MNVPFVDLKAQYEAIKEEIASEMQAVIDRTAFVSGPFVQDFEQRFAEYCGSQYAIAVGSGTAALWCALIAAGIGPGDEVITSTSTFIATAEAISFCGATPRFVDIDERTYTLAPEQLEAAINERTRAIIPVHLFGQMADMGPIMEIAKRHGLVVIEDACQAHGAEYRGQRAGSIADAGCFSFYPGKNLGAYGEGGAVVTDNPDIAERIRVFRDHGQSKKYYHGIVGWNTRMHGLQGAVLGVKLKYIDQWNEQRRQHAQQYGTLLGPVDGIVTPVEADYAKHVYHVYAIRVQERDSLLTTLGDKGISCGIHYPIPVHLQEAYSELGHQNGDFPVAEACASSFLSLPMFPELTEEQIAYVTQEVGNYMAVTV